MTRSTEDSVLHRASERVSAGAAAIALTFLTLLAVDVLAAESQASAPSITVSYPEVAFGSSAGAADVYRKLKAAARKVCGEYSGVRTLQMHISVRNCVDAALADAVRRIDRPTLSALHAAQTRNLG
jgi:UrcA family protein